MLEDKDNPFLPGSEAAKTEEEKEKKEKAEDESNPLIPGGKAAAEKEEQEAQEKLESPETNPFIPGAAESKTSLEKLMTRHDAIMLGGYVLIKEVTGKFSLLSPEGQRAEVSLIEVEKFRDNPEDLKDLFSK